jgi:hypothetical protein
MAFVDLKRSFVPVNKDEEANLSIGDQWGQRYAGWLSWAGLLERKRVVLLAEALSGKSDEFKHTASGLRAKGSFAFDTTIENLVDQAFLVKPDEQAALDRWKAGDEAAWFFLDSVDEALEPQTLERCVASSRCIYRPSTRPRTYPCFVSRQRLAGRTGSSHDPQYVAPAQGGASRRSRRQSRRRLARPVLRARKATGREPKEG